MNIRFDGRVVRGARGWEILVADATHGQQPLPAILEGPPCHERRAAMGPAGFCSVDGRGWVRCGHPHPARRFRVSSGCYLVPGATRWLLAISSRNWPRRFAASAASPGPSTTSWPSPRVEISMRMGSTPCETR